MSTHLSRYFRRRRLERRIELGDLARRCGYTNISKGANRIHRFEERGEITPALLEFLVTALEITPAEIEQCVTKDRADWQEWANKPTEPYLVVRLISGFYCRKSIPLALLSDRHGMEQFASDYAKTSRMEACLVLSRKLRVWFDQNGAMEAINEDTFEQSYGPFMSIGGHTFLVRPVQICGRQRTDSHGPKGSEYF